MVVAMQDLAPLEELERSRTEFLSLVSHELRAPLTSIKGSTTTVLTASPELDPAEQRAFFRIIDEQADHMRGLIGDLLDAGRIETGTLSVRAESSEVAELVDRARNTFLSGGGPTRHRGGPSCGPASRHGRPPAYRPGPEQPLRPTRLGTRRSHPPSWSGPCRTACMLPSRWWTRAGGVEPERLPHLFRKYAPGGEEGVTTGYGLGLAICKGLVDAHGGRIRAESGGRGPGHAIHLHHPGRGGRCRPTPGAVPRRSPRKVASAHASWLSTTIRTCCALFAMSFRGRATPRSSPATRGSCRG